MNWKEDDTLWDVVGPTTLDDLEERGYVITKLEGKCRGGCGGQSPKGHEMCLSCCEGAALLNRLALQRQEGCTCDEVGDGPCPVHRIANLEQDLRIANALIETLRSDLYEIARICGWLPPDLTNDVSGMEHDPAAFLRRRTKEVIVEWNEKLALIKKLRNNIVDLAQGCDDEELAAWLEMTEKEYRKYIGLEGDG